jgi:hypothetical protein
VDVTFFQGYRTPVLFMNGSLLIAAGATSFDAPKEAKVLSAERLPCRTSLCPANRAEPRAVKICPLLRRKNPTLQQKFTMPCSRTTHHVLPTFARSFSADQESIGTGIKDCAI